MCCEPKSAKASRFSDCCCGPGNLVRHFVSSGEEAENLQKYKQQLEKEIAGVDERIEDLKKR